jgi:hypothetical protein
MKIRGLLISFKPKSLFPPDDSTSVSLLTLMAATNEVRHLQRLLIEALEAQAGTSEPEQIMRRGETNYLFRMLCGHLYEAGLVFQRLSKLPAADLDRWLAGDREGQAALATIRAIFLDTSPGGWFERVLGAIRNSTAFHYNESEIRKALNAHTDDGRILASAVRGVGRYEITDQFMARSLFKAVGWGEKEFREAGQKAIELAGALGILVDQLVIQFALGRRDALLAEPSEVSIGVSEAEARAYERRRAERSAAVEQP